MTSNPHPARSAARSQAGRILFYGAVFAAGVAMFGFLGVRPLLLSRAARDWSEVRCRIESSEIKSHNGNEGTTYGVAIAYTYAFAGRSYRSERYQFLSISSGSRHDQEDIVAAYPPGSVQWCLVNPRDPTQAVLTRELPGALWLILPGSLAAIVVSLLGLHAARRAATRPAPPLRPGSPSAP